MGCGAPRCHPRGPGPIKGQISNKSYITRMALKGLSNHRKNSLSDPDEDTIAEPEPDCNACNAIMKSLVITIEIFPS